jgi:hypothetical protein
VSDYLYIVFVTEREKRRKVGEDNLGTTSFLSVLQKAEHCYYKLKYSVFVNYL